MTRQTVLAGTTITLTVPDEYVGKEVEVLIFTNEEAEDKTAFEVPEWQQKIVQKSTMKYEANPELLIAEEDAWKVLNA